MADSFCSSDRRRFFMRRRFDIREFLWLALVAAMAAVLIALANL